MNSALIVSVGFFLGGMKRRLGFLSLLLFLFCASATFESDMQNARKFFHDIVDEDTREKLRDELDAIPFKRREANQLLGQCNANCDSELLAPKEVLACKSACTYGYTGHLGVIEWENQKIRHAILKAAGRISLSLAVINQP